MARALFLDRDGVLVRDRGAIHQERLELLPGGAAAITRARGQGYLPIVVTNQTVVSRGVLSEVQVRTLHDRMRRELCAHDANAQLTAIYVCPHHPEATLDIYRHRCACRKPRDGMLRTAAEAHGIDLAASWMVGDRITDVIAGNLAGCRTVLLRAPETRGAEEIVHDLVVPADAREPTQVALNLTEAVHQWIAP